MRFMNLAIVAGIAGATALALAPNLGAAAPQQDMRVAQQQAPFTDAELKQYAVAVLEVRQINEEYMPKLQAAGSDDQRAAIRSEATDLMVEAIDGAGLTVTTYNEIYNASQSDPNVADKVDRYIREVQ